MTAVLAAFCRLAGLCVLAVATLGWTGPAHARTEIEFWHAMQGPRGEALEALVRAFNQSQDAFEVKPVYKGTYPEVYAAAMAAYRRQSAPHIVQAHDADTLTMILSGAIVPVQRLMKQQKLTVDWDDFIDTITGYYSMDGRLYSMPFNVSTPILFYNREAFRKAGLPDRPPATWPELETASRRLLAAGASRCGLTTSGSPSWDLLENVFPWHDQPFATNRNGYAGTDTRLLINGEFGQMHVGALARWSRERIFVPGPSEGTAERFENRECAMLIGESGIIGNFTRTLGFDWGAGQLPHWGPPYPKANTILGGATLWVMRGHGAEDYAGIARFIQFIAEPGQQIAWAKATGFVPVTRAALQRLQEEGFYARNPAQATAVGQLLNAKPTPNSVGLRLGNYVEVREAIELELENIYSGRKTVKEGLDSAVLRGNAILRQFRVSHEAAPQGEI